MTRARDMADLLDSNGDVKSAALDNVPAADWTTLQNRPAWAASASGVNWSDVLSPPTTATAHPAWGDVTGKPTIYGNCGNCGGTIVNCASNCSSGTPGYPGNRIIRSGDNLLFNYSNCNCDCRD